MKKILPLMIVMAMALTSVGQVAYAHDDNHGENQSSKHSQKADRFFQLKTGASFGLFNRHGENENTKENENKKNDNDMDEDDNAITIPHSITAVAKVTAVNGNIITAITTIGNSKTFTISTDANTNFTIRTGGTTLLSNIQAGDLIGFTGTLTSRNSSSYYVSASAVRDWGDVNLNAKVVATGTISSISASANQFTIIDGNGKSILVSSTDLTRFKNASTTPSAFANLTTGMVVKVKGFWNSLANIITAIKVRIL